MGVADAVPVAVRQPDVGRTGGADAVAGLGDVAHPDGAPADVPGAAERARRGAAGRRRAVGGALIARLTGVRIDDPVAASHGLCARRNGSEARREEQAEEAGEDDHEPDRCTGEPVSILAGSESTENAVAGGSPR